MGFPIVDVALVDQSSYVSSSNGVVAGIAGAFKKGPLETPVLCSGQSKILKWFTPDNTLKVGYPSCYQSAMDYTSNGGSVWVVRAYNQENPPKYGGVIINSGLSLNRPLSSGLDRPEAYTFTDTETMLILGSDPGIWNNDIGVQIITDPAKVGLENAFIIKVLKVIPNSNPTAYTDLESFTVSRDPDAIDGYGNAIYVEKVINGVSNYISVMDNSALDSSIMPAAQTSTMRFQRGSDGDPATDGDIARAYKKLSNPFEMSIQLLMNGGNTTPAVAQTIKEICEKDRKEECFGILTTPASAEVGMNAVTNLVNYRKNEVNFNSYCVSLYTPHVKVYDRYTDRYLMVSPDGMVASKISEAITNYGYNFPAAGYKRGVISALDVNNRFGYGDGEGMGDLDTLTDSQINCIINDPGRGVVIMGNSTMYATKSDLQDQNNMLTINLQIRPGLREFLKDYLFDLNDEITRSIIVDKITLFMNDIVAQRGVSEFSVVCDSSNNSDRAVQEGTLYIDLYLKMVKSIKRIKQSLIVTSQGIDFSNLSLVA